MLKIIARTIISFGINPFQIWYSLRGLPSYLTDIYKIKSALKGNADFKKMVISPCLSDKYQEGGDMNSIYFQQDLFVAQQVFLNRPINHLDIGSRTDGFVAHIATFRAIDVADIRDITSNESNIRFQQADMMQANENLIGKYDSVSSLHAIEHFGLGRYGDPIDPDGHIKAIQNIHRILQKDGIFYFSVPIGSQRIEFNAHRVFDVKYLMQLFEERFELQSFSYIDDKKNMFKHQTLSNELIERNFGCHYGCGIFILKKI